METFNIDEAETQLSRLVDRAAKGEPFIIAKAGKPLVMVVLLEPKEALEPFGFMKGELKVPDDFDTMAADEIAEMFGLKE